jgi:hypothetical protein
MNKTDGVDFAKKIDTFLGQSKFSEVFAPEARANIKSLTPRINKKT